MPVENGVVEDESWILSWDPGSKQSTSEWLDPGKPRPSKPCVQRAEAKVMLVVFFDAKGVIHKECTPRGLGIGGEIYLGILQRFREQIWRCRPEYWSGQQPWVLLHDGAPAHRANPVVQWLQSVDIKLLPHPGYSPDLSPADYWFFNRIKSCLQGIRFSDADEVQTTLNNVIAMVDPDEFQAAMDCYLPRLRKCIQAHGEHFKRD